MVHKKKIYKEKCFLPKFIKISKSHNSFKIQVWELKFCIHMKGSQDYFHAKNYHAKPIILENIAIFYFFEILGFLVPFPQKLAKNIFQKMKFVALGIAYM